MTHRCEVRQISDPGGASGTATGLIQPLTRWVLRQAARQAAHWRRSGMPLTVAVTISARSLLSSALPATVLSIVAAPTCPRRSWS